MTHHPEDAELYEHLGGDPIYLHRVGADDPIAEVSVRYRPTRSVE